MLPFLWFYFSHSDLQNTVAVWKYVSITKPHNHQTKTPHCINTDTVETIENKQSITVSLFCNQLCICTAMGTSTLLWYIYIFHCILFLRIASAFCQLSNWNPCFCKISPVRQVSFSQHFPSPILTDGKLNKCWRNATNVTTAAVDIKTFHCSVVY